MSTARRWPAGVHPVWSAAPPPPRVRKYERLRIVGVSRFRTIVVNDALEEIYTHQLNGRTVPCTIATGQCWLDHQVVGKERYYGWLAVQVVGLRDVQLLALTSNAVSLEPRLRDRGLSLRGLTFDVWRCHPHERSEMRCQLRLELPRLVELPPPPDVRFAINRMMEADDRPDDKNRVERRQKTGLNAMLGRSGQQ